MKGGMPARVVGGPDVTVAPLLMYPLRSERPDTGLQRPSCFSINLRLRFYGHLLVSRTDRMGSFPMVGRHIWPVLSRSWPSPHFLTSSHSDSRVEFIWYPPLVLLQSAKFREPDHLALILQFLFWPCSVLAKPGSIWTGLPWPPFPPPREGIPSFPCRESLLSIFTFPLLKCTGKLGAMREVTKNKLWICFVLVCFMSVLSARLRKMQQSCGVTNIQKKYSEKQLITGKDITQRPLTVCQGH